MKTKNYLIVAGLALGICQTPAFAVVQRGPHVPWSASTQAAALVAGDRTLGRTAPYVPAIAPGDPYSPTNATSGLTMTNGVVWTSNETNGRVYYGGSWFSNPYSNSAALFADVGVTTNGGMSADGTYNMASILSDSNKAAAFYANLSSIAPETLKDINANTTWNTNTGVAMVNRLNDLINGEAAYKRVLAFTLAPIFDQATTVGDPLNSAKGTIDFRNADITGVSLAGKDLSGLIINGNQLNAPNYVPTSDLHPTTPPAPNYPHEMDYTGTSFAGLNLSGFSPNDIPVFGGPQAYTNSGNFQNANFTGAQNLNVNVLARADNLSGAILTGTGITKAALTTAMLNLGIPQETIDSNLATTQF